MADDDRPTMMPFLTALAVVVVILIAVGLFNLLGGDGLTDEQQIGQAAVAQNDALQRQDHADFLQYTCRAEHGPESEFLTRQRDSVARYGERYIDGVSNVTVDGDRARATVTYHFDSTPDDTTGIETTFVREDGAWKVCSAVPG